MRTLAVTALPIRGVLKEIPIPKPDKDEVLIKVVATGSNPKDWKFPTFTKGEEFGDDIAGIVEEVGSNVQEYKPGDRVAAFHKMGAPYGSYAEYAIAPANTTFLLPPQIPFEEGATLPLASMTAALALFQGLGLPTPWNPVPEGQKLPIVIYGGASSVGAFALKFAKLANLNPIITVAGNGIDFVQSLNAADFIVDYRKKNVVNEIKEALGDLPLLHGFDAIGDHGSWNHITDVLQKPGNINMLDPPNGYEPPKGIKLSRTFVSTAYGAPHSRRGAKEAKEDGDFAFIFYRYISLLLKEGRFRGHPYEVLPNGLASVQDGIQLLYDHKVSSKKLIYRIADTPAL